MNLPAWLKDIVDHHGSQRLAGTVTRQEAVAAVRDEIAAKADDSLKLAIYADYAGRALDTWHNANKKEYAPLPGTASWVQSDLFPDLKTRLPIRVGVTKPVMALNARDWDNAREMVLNRTKYAIEGAEADRDSFTKAYDRVRPLLSGDATTADVVPELRGEVPLEGLAP